VKTRSCWIGAAILALALAAPLSSAQTPSGQPGERLSDKDVKAILEEVDHARDRFEDQLDDSIKSAKVRTADREVDVERYLNDLQDRLEQFRDRFNNNYAASTEAEAVLSQATAIDAAMKTRGQFKGASEWDRLAMQLRRLASAYGTDFPLPPSAAVRRINDGEVATTAEQVAEGAAQLKKQIGQEASLDQATKNTGQQHAEAVSRSAKSVRSRASSSKPGTGEMRELVRATDALGEFFGKVPPNPQMTQKWADMQAPLDILRSAYKLK